MTTEMTTTTEMIETIDGLKYLRAPFTIEDRPLPWQERGLTYTASGYGKKIPSSRVVRLPNGQTRRIYVTIFSNSGTAWINVAGETFVIVREYLAN